MKKFITAILAVTFLLIINNDHVSATAMTYPQTLDPFPMCDLAITDTIYSAIERDLPAADFSNKDHSWYIAKYSNTRLTATYSESVKIQIRPTSSNYQAFLYPFTDQKQHWIQYYATDFSQPISKQSPATNSISGTLQCLYASQNIVYHPEFYGTKWADVNDVATSPPSDGGDPSSGLSLEQVKGLFDQYIKPGYEVIGSIAAALTIGAVFYIFYRGIKLVHVRWLH